MLVVEIDENNVVSDVRFTVTDETKSRGSRAPRAQ